MIAHIIANFLLPHAAMTCTFIKALPSQNDVVIFTTLSRLFLLKIVVVHLYAEDYQAADGGDEVCGEQEYPCTTEHVALNHKAYSTYCHHQERCECYVVGVACLDGADSLWQITEDKTNACHPANYYIECTFCHSVSYLMFIAIPPCRGIYSIAC